MTKDIQISQNVLPARGLVVDGTEPCGSRDVLSVVRAAVSRVEVVSAAPELDSIDLDAFDFVVLTHDRKAHQKSPSLVRQFQTCIRRNQLLLHCPDATEQQLAEFILDLRVGHLFAYEDFLHADELYATIQKMVKRDVFGPEQYFARGAQRKTYELRSSKTVREASKVARDFAAEVGIPSRICDNYSLVAEEFLSNALYNAPVEPDRSPRFDDISRSHDVTLNEDEVVVLTLIRDGERIGMSVRDPFGSLATKEVLDYLGSCFRKSTDKISWSNQGAGLGLYQSLQRLSHLVVNLEPGSQTEMIGLISIQDCYADFASEGRAFNLFVRDSDDH